MKKGVKKIIGGGILFFVVMVSPFAILIPLFLQGDGIAFRVPGSTEISIEEAGRYYLWNNYNTIFEGQSYSFDKELPNGFSFSFVEKDSGLSIQIKPDLSVSSQSGSQKKSSIGYYEITTPGQYILSVSGDAEDRIFSFKKALFKNGVFLFAGIITGILITIVIAFGAIALIIFGIIDLVRESKATNTANSEL